MSAHGPAHATTLFVYGTLLRGEDNHAQMHGARYLRTAETSPGYALVDLVDWPALVVRTDATEPVAGELYRVTQAHLARLDAFEECPEQYLRAAVTLACGTPAEAYFLQPHRAQGLAVLRPPRWPWHAAARRRSRPGR